MTRAFVSLGSNLGDREAHLRHAVRALAATPGVRIVAGSRIYETDPVGPGPQGPYLNAVLELETDLGPGALLERLLAIEAERGRVRGARDAARTLDLDVLLHGDAVVREPGLELPHPRLAGRPFVLEPLADLAPERVVPGTGARVAALAERVRDPEAVRPFRGALGEEEPWRSWQ
ncbi:MAG: 2-amino-4-hydroxy-6-hydroxymethyldihydropteridine diphosphokinase [Myxococcota bacterium]|nr:2-amino-4-hydroxy-6-hydroxymethyldihydropteridine diphosphokinase [Myxococcota bacterium]